MEKEMNSPPALEEPDAERERFYAMIRESQRLTGHLPTSFDVWLMARGIMDANHRALTPLKGAAEPSEQDKRDLHNYRKLCDLAFGVPQNPGDYGDYELTFPSFPVRVPGLMWATPTDVVDEALRSRYAEPRGGYAPDAWRPYTAAQTSESVQVKGADK